MTEPGFDWEFQEILIQMSHEAKGIGRELPGYTSCAIDPLTGVLTVYHAGEEFDTAAFAALAEPGTSVVFRRALLSRAQQDHLFQIMNELRPAFEAAGVRITTWARSGDPSTTGMEATYMPATATLPAGLIEQLEIYGPGMVTFTPGDVVALAGL